MPSKAMSSVKKILALLVILSLSFHLAGAQTAAEKAEKEKQRNG